MQIRRRTFLSAVAGAWPALRSRLALLSDLPQAHVEGNAARSAPDFKLVATGSWVKLGDAPQGFDPAFSCGLQGWNIANGGSPASYHFAVKPSGQYLVAIGFYDPVTNPGTRVQNIMVDGPSIPLIPPRKASRGSNLQGKRSQRRWLAGSDVYARP